jgi:hypothetical protein
MTFIFNAGREAVNEISQGIRGEGCIMNVSGQQFRGLGLGTDGVAQFALLMTNFVWAVFCPAAENAIPVTLGFSGRRSSEQESRF